MVTAIVMMPCRLSAVVLMRTMPQVNTMGVMSATASSSAVCVVIDTGATPGPSNCSAGAEWLAQCAHADAHNHSGCSSTVTKQM